MIERHLVSRDIEKKLLCNVSDYGLNKVTRDLKKSSVNGHNDMSCTQKLKGRTYD